MQWFLSKGQSKQCFHFVCLFVLRCKISYNIKKHKRQHYCYLSGQCSNVTVMCHWKQNIFLIFFIETFKLIEVLLFYLYIYLFNGILGSAGLLVSLTAWNGDRHFSENLKIMLLKEEKNMKMVIVWPACHYTVWVNFNNKTVLLVKSELPASQMAWYPQHTALCCFLMHIYPWLWTHVDI